MRLVLLVVGLLVASALVASCGGDDEGGGGGADTGAQTQPGATATTTETATTTTEDGGGGGADTSDPQVKQAVESCKQQINAQPGISEAVRSDLEEICQKAASGDEREVREATKEVCRKLIEENVPDGPAREQALASCDQAAPSP